MPALPNNNFANLDNARQFAQFFEDEEKAAEEMEQRRAVAAEVSALTGVPTDLLECCSDREAMEGFAEAYVAEVQSSIHSAPKAPTLRLSSEEYGRRPSNAEVFSEMINEHYGYGLNAFH